MKAFYLVIAKLKTPQKSNVASFDAFLGYRRIQIMHKSSGEGKPKKTKYHRVHELDRVMDLHKKPAVVLRLKSIIQSQKTESLLLRDLEKEVGFVQKWNYIALIEKYPTIFRVTGGQNGRCPPVVMFTEKAKKVAALEAEARERMEPILIRNLRKLLMLSVDCRLPFENIELIASELGMPEDFRYSIVEKNPQFFKLNEYNGRLYLYLENWDSSLAVTAREEGMARQMDAMPSLPSKGGKVSRDGNFSGPFAFRINFAAGFRPYARYLEGLQKWQELEFPSPYLNARRINTTQRIARKRAVAVLHELLSLTMEKRLTSAQLAVFQFEYRLPINLLLCIVRHHGIFYITNKGIKSTVFLKDAYDGPNLVDKCPLLEFRDYFMALIGREDSRLPPSDATS